MLRGAAHSAKPSPVRPNPPGHCTGQASGTVAAMPPLPSHVRLNFSCNVVVVQRHEVLEAYERAVTAFSRPVDPDFPSGNQQVRWRVAGRLPAAARRCKRRRGDAAAAAWARS